MTQNTKMLFTIGHSDHELADFIGLLTRHGVTAIADVRSQPYSRFHAQFNREVLTEALKQASIRYVFLGRELGARRSERESYLGKQARYELVRKLPAFREGLERVRKGMAAHRVALMCAEKDPLTCHRTILVGRQLRAEGTSIHHILEDGTIETTEEAEIRLLGLAGLPQEDLFRSRRELIELAYDLQSDRIAYTESDTPAATLPEQPA